MFNTYLNCSLLSDDTKERELSGGYFKEGGALCDEMDFRYPGEKFLI